jgi:hypothetical protein
MAENKDQASQSPESQPATQSSTSTPATASETPTAIPVATTPTTELPFVFDTPELFANAIVSPPQRVESTATNKSTAGNNPTNKKK